MAGGTRGDHKALEKVIVASEGVRAEEEDGEGQEGDGAVLPGKGESPGL